MSCVFLDRVLLCVLTTNAASSVSLTISNMKYYSSVVSTAPPVLIHLCPIFLCSVRSPRHRGPDHTLKPSLMLTLKATLKPMLKATLKAKFKAMLKPMLKPMFKAMPKATLKATFQATLKPMLKTTLKATFPFFFFFCILTLKPSYPRFYPQF